MHEVGRAAGPSEEPPKLATSPGEQNLLEAPVIIVNPTPFDATPLTETTTLPVVAPLGTGATIVVAFQLVGVALVPLKVTVFDPWVALKEPVIVTPVPTAPELGDR